MKLSVYSLQKILFQGDASLISCNTMMGRIAILNNHETFIGVLEPGVVKVIDASESEHFFEVQSGFLEVREGNEVRCLVD